MGHMVVQQFLTGRMTLRSPSKVLSDLLPNPGNKVFWDVKQTEAALVPAEMTLVREGGRRSKHKLRFNGSDLKKTPWKQKIHPANGRSI